MVSIKARLATGEHILARVLQNKFSDLRVRIVKFYSDYGEIDFVTKNDLRDLDVDFLEDDIKKIVSLDLDVKIETFDRGVAEELFDLGRISVKKNKIRIVSIGDFDSRPCGDSHVSNTSEIGNFIIHSIKRVGANRYRIKFSVA